ncbi:DoxX family protein [Frankia sp. AgB32]|uniref:DoxX family protein n=1 Tax=Frankia sp. AgB32 TaxID=631119 RepID=UPI00200CEAD7|nr:MauE/DoxX family redox-associated membrane protein [Frankia sp. AgB32]MCK9893319.1 DoxX family membrane protein [Frankia sp. AgB32]
MNTIAHRLSTPTQPTSRVVSTVLRLVLGAVWLAAGLLKVNDPDGMLRSARAFRILPEALVQPVAYAVPFLEIALGLLLIVGLAVRVTAIVSALMFATYIAAIASAAARGLRIDCGCFSSGGDLTADAPTHYTSELIRDSLLLAAAALLAWRPAGYLSADRLLDRPGDHESPADDRFGSDTDGLED